MSLGEGAEVEGGQCLAHMMSRGRQAKGGRRKGNNKYELRVWAYTNLLMSFGASSPCCLLGEATKGKKNNNFTM